MKPILPQAFALLLGLVSLTSFIGASLAVDVPNRNPPAEERALREARQAIAASDWSAAVRILQAHTQTDPDDADAHNLLGYGLRKLGRYAASRTAYERALHLDPSHRGAHEYLGELMLTLGQRDRALFHLGELERLCQASCPEYQQLRRAIEGPSATPGNAAPGRAW